MRRVWLVAVMLVACGDDDISKPRPFVPEPKPPPPPVDAPRETIARGNRFAIAIPEGFEKRSTGQALAGQDVMLAADGPRTLYAMRIGYPNEMHGKDAKGCREIADRITKTGATLVSAEIVKHKRFGNVCRSIHNNDLEKKLISYTISLGDKDTLAVQCGFPGGDEPEFCTRALDEIELHDDPTKKPGKPKQ